MALDGVEIISNSSGSHHELRKAYVRVDLIKTATMKVCRWLSHNAIVSLHGNTNHKHHHVPLQNGGVYMFSNVHGCDGERTYYDGCSSVAVNGDFVVQGAQFTIKDVVCSA